MEVRVSGIQQEKGVKSLTLQCVSNSHWHFDHTGDMTKLPSKVNLVVGEGFKENLLPGYPTNPDSALLESDYQFVPFHSTPNSN